MERSSQRKAAQQIDVVYLWVNGADPRWQAKRQRTFSRWSALHSDSLATHGNVAGRFRDNGELRFSLRALERFFPDHGHVYIVTDSQVPGWLASARGVSIVDHRELIPPSARPVFDSGHIESYVHHIPGLAERYFYLNDDVFFGAPIDPQRWFGDRLTVAMETERHPRHAELSPDKTALVNASIMSAQWLGRTYSGYQHDWRLLSHAPRPMLRSAMFELERLAPEVFDRVRSTTFRSRKVPSIVSDLAPRWMVHTGLAESVAGDPRYICTDDEHAEQAFARLQAEFGRVPFFCINDTCDDAPDHDPRLMRARRAMNALFPLPSRFERCAAAGPRTPASPRTQADEIATAANA
jgi:Stealth protein CR2, conserved region 2/Stealth protein CR1, conserved region 1